MGRYVPPDIEGTKLSGNALHRRRAPGTANARGSQTVRFEMPFAVWCAHCPRPTLIPQGVRFNADKSRDGAYYSTPIWRFRLRHADCGGEIVMRTDPKNTAYEVVSGGKKRDHGPEEERQEGGAPILTDTEREELRKNAFAKLERTIDDREQLRQAGERIEGLLEASARQWDDPYAQNQKLRRAFRVGRKERERDAAATEDLQGRMGLGIDLLPASDEDARRAAVVDFMPSEGADGGDALAKPLFGGEGKKPAGPERKKGVTKAEREAAKRKGGFVAQVMGNTRVVRDPFLNGSKVVDGRGSTRLPGVKRKREGQDELEPPAKAPAQASSSSLLVNYDSD